MGLLLCLLSAPLAVPVSRGMAQEATPAAAPTTAAGVAHLGGDLPGDPQIQLVEVASGLSDPVGVAFPPDGSGRIFYISNSGTIGIVHADGSSEPEPFLDLSATVALRPGEQGLLGLAFHPDFATNGKFYVHYNNLFKNGAITVSEFQVSKDNPNKADPETERPLLVIEKPYPQHNGGALRFGADGYLYISTGDGGWQGDAYDNAQSRFSLLGKILRIDVDSAAPGQPYGIPADNPFNGPGRYDNPYPGQEPKEKTSSRGERTRERRGIGSISNENRKNLSPVRKEIWALGFRNPWQFAFDSANGDIYIGDVGADKWEEIDYQPAGATAGQNYGWDWLEASHCFPDELTECPRQQVGVLPVAEYAHGGDGCAVIAIGVYRGETYPSLDGVFFSADYCTGEVRGLQRDENGVWQFQRLLDTALQITGGAQDADGNLYVTSLLPRAPGADVKTGSIWKIVSADKVPAGAATAPLGEPARDEDTAGAQSEPAAPAATPAPAAATPAAAAAEDVTIAMEDIFFEPRRVTIPANTDVRIVLPNNGATRHNFTLGDISIDVEPGDTGEVTVNLPPGRHQFECNIPGHQQAGMSGVIVAKTP